MEQATAALHSSGATFGHIRVLLACILGLCITRLLTGIARFIQHPSKMKVDAVHMAWVAFIFLIVVRFWYLEYAFVDKAQWAMHEYMFLILIIAVLFLLCTLLFPDTLDEYKDHGQFFIDRRRWFFGLLMLFYLLDVQDTLMKGHDHFAAYGVIYPIQVAGMVLLGLTAAVTPNRKFHLVFVYAAIVYEVWFTLDLFIASD